QIRKLAENVSDLPRVERSPDPADDFLLALAEAGRADYLVTGDKSGLLNLASHKATRIIAAGRVRRTTRMNVPNGSRRQRSTWSSLLKPEVERGRSRVL